MYRLMVSRDGGYHYQLYDQDESLEELKKRATKYDEQGLPWTIDDENGKSVEFSQIHKEIIDSIVHKYHGKGRSGYSF